MSEVTNDALISKIHIEDVASATEFAEFNPYAFDLDSPEAMLATWNLINSRMPFLDPTNYPDMETINSHGKVDRSLVVYKLEGRSPFTMLARAVEGEVMEKAWTLDRETARKDMEPYDDISSFFLLVDYAGKDEFGNRGPKVAGVLRIADCLKGKTDTQDYYLHDRPRGARLPSDLKVTDIDRKRGLWDVIGVMVRDEYRDGIASAWLYHALYSSSLAEDVHRWIGALTDREYTNLSGLGIPFNRIPGTPMKHMERKNKSPIPLTFHACKVDDIAESMMLTIDSLNDTAEKSEYKMRSFFKLLSKIAQIALAGQAEIPVAPSEVSNIA
jgi:hypothetical protein